MSGPYSPHFNLIAQLYAVRARRAKPADVDPAVAALEASPLLSDELKPRLAEFKSLWATRFTTPDALKECADQLQGALLADVPRTPNTQKHFDWMERADVGLGL